MNVSDLHPAAGGRLQFTRLGLGCAPLAGLYEPASDADAQAVLQAAWDAGLRCFDTAPYYGYTHSEHRVGRFLRDKPRAAFVLSTKVGRLMQPDASVGERENGWARPLPFRPRFDYSYDGVMRSFEHSLQRLGVARIDILLVHDVGRYTHGDAHPGHWQALTGGGGFRALDELRRAGCITAFGLGVNEAQVVHDSLQEAQLDCVLLAGRYTLLEQAALPLLDDCARRGTAVLIGGPFNSGLLAGNGKFDYADAPAPLLARAEALRTACARFGVPLQAAALQFPLAHPAVASCVAGMRSAEQVAQNVDWFQHPIPVGLWPALQARGLVAESAPCPGQGPTEAVRAPS